MRERKKNVMAEEHRGEKRKGKEMGEKEEEMGGGS